MISSIAIHYLSSSKMSGYKLTYFNIRARGEPVRMMLKLAGVEYEERKVEFGSEEWKKEKSGTCSKNEPIQPPSVK